MPIKISTVDNEEDLNEADVIILVEGYEGEIFPLERGKIPSDLYNLEIVFINCHGDSGVSRDYDLLCESGFQEKLIPCIDQDARGQKKSDKQSGKVWGEIKLYTFIRSFEDIFDDWILADAINRYINPNFNIDEEFVATTRSSRDRNETMYDALFRAGVEKFPGQGFQMPGKRKLTEYLGDVMIDNYWIPNKVKLWIDHIMRYAQDNKGQRDSRTEPGKEIHWDVVRDLKLTGSLIYISENHEFGVIDFDNLIDHTIDSLKTLSVIPLIRPMWSISGERLAFTGKIRATEKNIVMIVDNEKGKVGEFAIDLGDPLRPTSLLDWDPDSDDFLFVQGPDVKGYCLWRAKYDATSIKSFEPATRGASSFLRANKDRIGVSGGEDGILVIFLDNGYTVLGSEIWKLEDGEYLNQPRSVIGRVLDGKIKLTWLEVISDSPDRQMIIRTGICDPQGKRIRKVETITKPIRTILDMCWSPDGAYVLFTDVTDAARDDKWLLILDIKNKKVYPLINQNTRIGNRSWFPNTPIFLEREFAKA